MARFFLPPSAWLTEPALAGDEARHLSQVLRMKVGDSIIVFDGHGRRASAEILNISRDKIPLKLKEILPSRTPLPVITLAQAIPKGKNMDLIVQKSVELGISAIQPLITETRSSSPVTASLKSGAVTPSKPANSAAKITSPSSPNHSPSTHGLAPKPMPLG